jgi:TolB protein
MTDIARKLALTAVAALTLVAGCSSSTGSTAQQHGSTSAAAPAPATTSASATPAATPAVAKGVERGIGDVPWAQVGPGWMLAMWSPVTPHMPGVLPAPGEPTSDTANTTLYLVDPATGNRYTITTFTPDDHEPHLVDWSGDGSHALFSATYGGEAKAISIDLHTGERTEVPVDGTPEYTRPDGKALLVSKSFNGNEPGTLKRIDMSGHQQLAYPTDDLGGAGRFSGDYLESPDGTQLVLGTANLGNEVVPRSDNSLVVMDNNGSIVRTLPVPIPKAYCAPVKWWKPTVFLAHCSAERFAGEQLWEVPIDGGKPTALTAFNSAHGDDPGFEGNLGNWNAFELPTGVFLPTAGACGTTFVSRLTPDGHTTRVQIPGASGSVGLAGVSGDKLVVHAYVGCGGGTSLLTYDPVANTSTVLLGPPINGGGVSGGRLYPDEK